MYGYQIDYREEKRLGHEFTVLEIRRVVVSPICNQLGVPLQVYLCKIS